MKNLISRRGFLLLALTAPFVSLVAWGARKTVTTTEAAAAKALVKPTDTMPSALKYAEDAAKATGRSDKSASCGSCMHYSQAVTADGKDIKVKGSAVGSCALFDAGKGFVKSGGWCMSFFKNPA